MFSHSRLTRREFIGAAALGAATAGISHSVAGHAGAARAPGKRKTFAASAQRIPLKIGIRAASLQMVGDFEVIKTAASIPGILGVELQVSAGAVNLRDGDVVRRYKREADRWGMHIPSLAGVWDPGVTIRSPNATDHVIQSVRAAELLGSRVVLLAFFKENAPDMAREDSYGPLVAMLQKAAQPAADAGVVLGLENSLSPADNKRLVDLVDHPAVGVYYDLHNMAFYGHRDEAIPGIKLLGKKRIAAVHVKNEDKLLEEPGLIDWAAAFGEFNEIQYEGWYVYESGHKSAADCIEDTKKNNAFLRKHVEMPMG